MNRNSLFFERARRTRAACGPSTAVAALLLILLFARPASLGAATLQLESNQTLFYVMCAINAAGYDEGINLPDNSPLRKQVRDYLAGRKISVLPELKLFYRHHMGKSSAQDLPQYVSFALSVNGAPDFGWKVRDVDIPPDAMALEGFQTLMIDFYLQADLATLWEHVQPAYEKEIGQYHTPILNMTGIVDGYLRASSADFPNRHFHAIVEPLTAPQRIQTYHYGDHTYVIMSPAAQPLIYDIRHAYLFFLIDPVLLTYRVDVQQKRSMLDLVQTAPLTDEVKTDFVLLASQSLVKAVEARMDKDSNAIDRATRQGYIMTPYFAEHLPEFENQPQSMRFYADVMVNAIDLKLETSRLSNVKFDAAPLQRKATQVVIAGPELSPAGKTLEKAESLYTEGKASPNIREEAKSLFGKALDQKGEPAEHAQAWYGLARIALLENRADVAIDGFQKALESAPDEFTQAWADVYLGRLYKSRHDFTQAQKYYEAALAVKGASDKAKQAANSELQEISKNQEKQTP